MSNIAINKGNLALEGFRIDYDPDKWDGKGKIQELRIKDIETLTGNIQQSWDSVIGDTIQKYKWKNLSETCFEELQTRWLETVADPTTEHTLTNYKTSEVYTISIRKCDGKWDQGLYHNVDFRFKIISVATLV